MTYLKDNSDLYNYYIIRIKFENKYSYCLWGTNTRRNDDEFLVNKDNLILKFNSIKEIKQNIKTIRELNYMKRRFDKWVNEFMKLKSPRSYATFDFDLLKKIFF